MRVASVIRVRGASIRPASSHPPRRPKTSRRVSAWTALGTAAHPEQQHGGQHVHRHASAQVLFRGQDEQEQPEHQGERGGAEMEPAAQLRLDHWHRRDCLQNLRLIRRHGATMKPCRGPGAANQWRRTAVYGSMWRRRVISPRGRMAPPIDQCAPSRARARTTRSSRPRLVPSPTSSSRHPRAAAHDRARPADPP